MKNKLNFILKIALLALLIGKGVLFAFHDSHLSEVIIGSAYFDMVIAFLCFVGCLFVLFEKYVKRLMFWWMGAISLGFLLHSVGAFIHSGFLLEQLIEHSLQITLPLLWAYYRIEPSKVQKWYLFEIMVALTFIGHGLFALGIHGVPTGFIDMTTTILGVSESYAINFLYWIGLMDIILAISIFIKGLNRIALSYMLLWGVITAFARFQYGYMLIDHPELYSHYLPNFIYRLCHGIIPGMMLLQLISERENLTQASYSQNRLSKVDL